MAVTAPNARITCAASRRLRHDRTAVAAAVTLLAVVVVAAAAPLVASAVGHGPAQQYLDVGLSPTGIPLAPNGTFLLGTDSLGRDILVRIAYGTRFLALPWLSIALGTAATYSRLTRGAMLDVLGEDYIRTARAKGLTERRITYRHALRSSLTPAVSQFGIDMGSLLGGAIVTEVVFGLPGLGREAVQSITTQDLPVIMGITMLSTVLVVAANLVVDVWQGMLDTPGAGVSNNKNA